MQPKLLYIIGNGFDLHHGIASDYKSFRNFVKRYNDDVFEIAKRYLFQKDNLMSVFRTLKQRGHDPINTIISATKIYLETGKLPPLPPKSTSDG